MAMPAPWCMPPMLWPMPGILEWSMPSASRRARICRVSRRRRRSSRRGRPRLAVIAPRLGRSSISTRTSPDPAAPQREGGRSRSRIEDDELIQVPAAGRDRPLGEPGNAVHVIADGDAMPVDAGWSRQTVLEVDSEELSSGHPQLWPRKRTIEGPGLRRPTSKVDDVGAANSWTAPSTATVEGRLVSGPPAPVT